MSKPASGVRPAITKLSLLAFCMLCVSGQGTAAATEDAREPGQTATSADLPELTVEVPYATNRGRNGSGSAPDSYTGDRGEPHYGVCRVVFKRIAMMDGLASKLPFYVPSETREVQIAEQAEPRVFWGHLSKRVSETRERSVVLFVHGYNYGFERTCRMGAELRRRLAGISEVVLFSWPSNGNPGDYLQDQVDVEWSVPFLVRTIARLKTHLGHGTRVHVMAHSLGSRGTFFSLERLRADLGNRPLLDQLILLAPDFDAETFADVYSRISPLARHVTLYASSKDNALAVSRQLNGHPRLGEGGEYLTLIEGMDTIDVSEAGRYQFTGHEYHLYHPRVGADLVDLVSSRRPAAEREDLVPRTRQGLPYWAIPADAAP
jgi:esterase/lipase superfamily enzyme